MIATVLLPALAARGAAQTRDSLATLRVRVVEGGRPIAGAVVRTDTVARATDDAGLAMLRLVPGSRRIVAMRIGFNPDSITVDAYPGMDTTFTIALEAHAAGVEGIIVSATRAERRVQDTPLRVEVIDEEEVGEKAAMTPGDIAMMMNETSGLRVANTSPALGGANVRIQGLRGRYTLLLADGLPLYGGPVSFGLLQIPPLDLQRAEVIKGTASALYGASALGGVVNLVSRRPRSEAEHEAVLNQTSRGGTDGLLYLAGPVADGGRLGASLLASGHRQALEDVNGDGWADLSRYTRGVARPRLFFDGDRGSLFATAGVTVESRAGGTVGDARVANGASRIEALDTRRGDAGIVGRWRLNERDAITIRSSAAGQRHTHRFGNVLEHDRHATSFLEASTLLPRGAWTPVIGAAIQTDDYRNRDVAGFDFAYRVPSLFAQTDVDIAPWLVASVSAREDWHNVFGANLSPRASLLLRQTGGGAAWTARLSAASGSYAPTPLTEEVEATGLTPVRPSPTLRRERGRSGSIDIGGPVQTAAGLIELNATVHGSRIEDPVAVQEVNDAGRPLVLVNAAEPTRTWGIETLARFSRGDARLTASYAYLRATEWDRIVGGSARRATPLAPRHTAGLVGGIEREDEGRIGIELYYTGQQALEDNPYRTRSPAFLIVGMLVERQVATPAGCARIFLNAENLGDVRQTRYDPLLLRTPAPGGRWTTDVWTELAGRTFNAGIRLAF